MHAEIHGSGIVGGSQTRRLNKMSKKRRALEASLGLNDGTQVESMIKDCSSIQSINNLEDPGMVNFQKISKNFKNFKNFKKFQKSRTYSVPPINSYILSKFY